LCLICALAAIRSRFQRKDSGDVRVHAGIRNRAGSPPHYSQRATKFYDLFKGKKIGGKKKNSEMRAGSVAGLFTYPSRLWQEDLGARKCNFIDTERTHEVRLAASQ